MIPALEALAICLQTRHMALIESGPGEGKTSAINALVRKLGWDMVTIIASIHEPSDFNGWPTSEDGVMRFLPPAWARRAAESTKPFVVFLDETSTAAPTVQSALLRPINERYVGEQYLGDHVVFVGACNPVEDSPGGWELAAPMANRMIHLPWEVPFDDWAEGMMSGWPDPGVRILPESWRNHIPWATGLVLGYLRANRSNYQTKPVAGARAFATNRTWEKSMHLLAACRAVGYGTEERVPAMLLDGTVGHGPATGLLTWLRTQDLPDPEDVLKQATTYDFTGLRGDQVFTILGSVISAVLSNNTPDRWAAGWDVLFNVGESKLDVATQGARFLARNPPPASVKRILPSKARMFSSILQAAGQLSQ